MRIALVIEIEELVFDTLAMRAEALHAALAGEGIVVPLAEVHRAHTGVTAQMALTRIPAAIAALDVVGESLTLRRAADAMREALELTPPTFDPVARDALAALSAAFPVGVVTRAARDAALRMLEQAGLDHCTRAVRSLAEIESAAQPSVWSSVLLRLRADGGVAIAGGAILSAAALAGLRTVQIGGAPVAGADAMMASLHALDASFIASLF